MEDSARIRVNHCVYALYSMRDQSVYVGYTENLRLRLGQHRRGEVPSTRMQRPWQMIFCEYFVARSDAMRREAYLKTPAGERSLRFNLAESLQIAGSVRAGLLRRVESFMADSGRSH